MSLLITGGTKGIGLGIARRFSAPGTKIFLNYVSDDAAAEQAKSSVEALGGEVILLKRDITQWRDAEALLADVAQHTDHLDQLVHGAVYPYVSRLLSGDPDEIDRAIAVNGTALIHLTRAALPLLGANSSVFFLSSRGSKVAIPNYGSIGGPKAMAEAFIRYLAIELAEIGARAHVVSCSMVVTDALRRIYGDNLDQVAEAAAASNPLKRNVTPEDVGEMVYFLSSSAAGMMTGREVFIDGGIYSKPG